MRGIEMIAAGYQAVYQYRKGRKAYINHKKLSPQAGNFYRLGYKDAMFEGAQQEPRP